MPDKGLRVAILTWDTPPMPSGLGRAAFEIAAALRARGCDVTLFDASRPPGSSQRLLDIAVIGCAAPRQGPWAMLRRRAGLGHHVAPRFLARAFQAEHAQRPFDVAEATNWYAPALDLVNAPVPLVVRLSTPALDTLPGTIGLRDRLDLRHAHRLERACVRGADALISNTVGHKRAMERLYAIPPETRHRVIGLALDPATIAAGQAAAPPPEGPPRALFVGRRERRKGFDEAVAAHLLFAADRRAAGEAAPHLDIVGVESSDLAPVLCPADPALAATVTAHGRVADAQMHALMARATVVLAPSRYESYGLVYREAAAFGRPLVACAEDPAASEFVGQTGCGVLCERCEPEAIVVALRRLHGEPDLRRRARRAGLRAAGALSRERLADETLAVYAAARERRAPRGRHVR